METIGARIKFARKNKGLTQTQMYSLIGISSGNLSDIENDKSMPSATALISLGRELNVSIDWILTGKEFQNDEIEEVRAIEAVGSEGIEFLAIFNLLTKENRLRLEGVLQGMVLGQGSEDKQNKKSQILRNGNTREESAARAGA